MIIVLNGNRNIGTTGSTGNTKSYPGALTYCSYIRTFYKMVSVDYDSKLRDLDNI